MKAQDIIDEVRRGIHDENAPYKVADELMRQFVVDGQNDIVSNSTEAATDSDGTKLTVTDPDNPGATLSIGNEWRSALFKYVAGRSFELRGFDSENRKRADKMWERYQKDLM